MTVRASERQRLPAALCGLVVVVLVATTSASANQRSTRAPALTRIDVVAAAITSTAPVFYAQERGFFRQEGLDVKIRILADPTQYVPALLSGDADFAPNSVGGLTLAKSKGAPVRMVASGILHRPLAPTAFLVARKGRGSTGPETCRQDGLHRRTQPAAAHRPAALAEAERRLGERRRVPGDPLPADALPARAWRCRCGPDRRPYLTLCVAPGGYARRERLQGRLPEHLPAVGLVVAKRSGSDAHSEVPERDPGGIRLGRPGEELTAADAILSKNTLIPRALLRTTTRSYYAQRLVPRLAQPWIDAYAEFGVIPASFPAIDS